MPAKSKKQQRAAGMALAMKRGETPKKAGAARQMAESMTQAQLADFARKPKKKRTLADGY